MRQVLVEQLRPGDCIQTATDVARVVDVPAKCYAGSRIYVLVPIADRGAAVVERRYAPGDFVSLADRFSAVLATSGTVVSLVAMVGFLTFLLFALTTLSGMH